MQKKIEEEKQIALNQKAEEEERIREENRRIKAWEDKFDLEQKKKEEELINKFYNEELANPNELKNSENSNPETKVEINQNSIPEVNKDVPEVNKNDNEGNKSN